MPYHGGGGGGRGGDAGERVGGREGDPSLSYAMSAPANRLLLTGSYSSCCTFMRRGEGEGSLVKTGVGYRIQACYVT